VNSNPFANQDYDVQNTTAMTTAIKKTKITDGRGGGFRVAAKNNKSKTQFSKYKNVSKPKSSNANLSKEELAVILEEFGIKSHISQTGFQDKMTDSTIPQYKSPMPSSGLQGNKTSVRGLIDQMYQREKKYIKQYFKEDYIQHNDFIFNLGKTHQLKLAKTRDSSAEQSSKPSIFPKTKEEDKKVILVNGFNV
jgi:hypothetical protein